MLDKHYYCVRLNDTKHKLNGRNLIVTYYPEIHEKAVGYLTQKGISTLTSSRRLDKEYTSSVTSPFFELYCIQSATEPRDLQFSTPLESVMKDRYYQLESKEVVLTCEIIQHSLPCHLLDHLSEKLKNLPKDYQSDSVLSRFLGKVLVL